MDCAAVEPLAAELALGLFAGPTRAEALAHIETCATCRALVDSLSAAADDVMLLAPSAVPSSGFEQRVLAALSPVRPVERSRSRRWPILAAAAAVIAVVAVGLSVRSHPPAVREAEMRTATGRVVGDAYVHRGDPSWVVVAVPGWTDTRGSGAPKQYEVRLTMNDGTSRVLPGGDLDGGDGAWGTVLPIDASQIHQVALVDDDGAVWCSATL
jgi:hypothetical protein